MTLSLTALCLMMLAANSHAFEMQTLQDKRTSLHNIVGDGRWAVVMLWAKDCVSCEEQKPLLESFHQKYKNSKAHAIGISTDGMQQIEYIKSNIARHNTSYTNLAALTDVFSWQFEQETGKAFRVTPTYLLYFPDGKLAGVRHGPIDFAVLEKVINEE